MYYYIYHFDVYIKEIQTIHLMAVKVLLTTFTWYIAERILINLAPKTQLCFDDVLHSAMHMRSKKSLFWEVFAIILCMHYFEEINVFVAKSTECKTQGFTQYSKYAMKGVKPSNKIDLCAQPIVCTTQSNHKGN